MPFQPGKFCTWCSNHGLKIPFSFTHRSNCKFYKCNCPSCLGTASKLKIAAIQKYNEIKENAARNKRNSKKQRPFERKQIKRECERQKTFEEKRYAEKKKDLDKQQTVEGKEYVEKQKISAKQNLTEKKQVSGNGKNIGQKNASHAPSKSSTGNYPPYCVFCKNHGFEYYNIGQHYKSCKYRACPCRKCTDLRGPSDANTAQDANKKRSHPSQERNESPSAESSKRPRLETADLPLPNCPFCLNHNHRFPLKPNHHSRFCMYKTCSCAPCKRERKSEKQKNTDTLEKETKIEVESKPPPASTDVKKPCAVVAPKPRLFTDINNTTGALPATPTDPKENAKSASGGIILVMPSKLLEENVEQQSNRSAVEEENCLEQETMSPGEITTAEKDVDDLLSGDTSECAETTDIRLSQGSSNSSLYSEIVGTPEVLDEEYQTVSEASQSSDDGSEMADEEGAKDAGAIGTSKYDDVPVEAPEKISEPVDNTQTVKNCTKKDMSPIAQTDETSERVGNKHSDNPGESHLKLSESVDHTSTLENCPQKEEALSRVTSELVGNNLKDIAVEVHDKNSELVKNMSTVENYTLIDNLPLKLVQSSSDICQTVEVSLNDKDSEPVTLDDIQVKAADNAYCASTVGQTVEEASKGKNHDPVGSKLHEIPVEAPEKISKPVDNTQTVKNCTEKDMSPFVQTGETSEPVGNKHNDNPGVSHLKLSESVHHTSTLENCPQKEEASSRVTSELVGSNLKDIAVEAHDKNSELVKNMSTVENYTLIDNLPLKLVQSSSDVCQTVEVASNDKDSEPVTLDDIQVKAAGNAHCESTFGQTVEEASKGKNHDPVGRKLHEIPVEAPDKMSEFVNNMPIVKNCTQKDMLSLTLIQCSTPVVQTEEVSNGEKFEPVRSKSNDMSVESHDKISESVEKTPTVENCTPMDKIPLKLVQSSSNVGKTNTPNIQNCSQKDMPPFNPVECSAIVGQNAVMKESLAVEMLNTKQDDVPIKASDKISESVGTTSATTNCIQKDLTLNLVEWNQSKDKSVEEAVSKSSRSTDAHASNNFQSPVTPTSLDKGFLQESLEEGKSMKPNIAIEESVSSTDGKNGSDVCKENINVDKSILNLKISPKESGSQHVSGVRNVFTKPSLINGQCSEAIGIDSTSLDNMKNKTSITSTDELEHFNKKTSVPIEVSISASSLKKKTPHDMADLMAELATLGRNLQNALPRSISVPDSAGLDMSLFDGIQTEKTTFDLPAHLQKSLSNARSHIAQDLNKPLNNILPEKESAVENKTSDGCPEISVETAKENVQEECPKPVDEVFKNGTSPLPTENAVEAPLANKTLSLQETSDPEGAAAFPSSLSPVNSVVSLQKECDLCSKKFYAPSSFRVHQYVEHNVDNGSALGTMHQCRECPYENKSEMAILDHESGHMSHVPLDKMLKLFCAMSDVLHFKR